MAQHEQKETDKILKLNIDVNQSRRYNRLLKLEKLCWGLCSGNHLPHLCFVFVLGLDLLPPNLLFTILIPLQINIIN